MEHDIVVRPCHPGDRQCYVDMNLEFMEFIRSNNPYWEELRKPSADEMGKRFDEAVADAAHISMYLIEADGQPAGFSNTWHVYSIWAGGMTITVDDLFLRQEFRGIGVGKAFFDYLSGWGRSNGYKRIQLTGEVFNTHAARFYERYGFSSETARFFMYLL